MHPCLFCLRGPAQRHFTRHSVIVAVDGNTRAMPKHPYSHPLPHVSMVMSKAPDPYNINHDSSILDKQPPSRRLHQAQSPSESPDASKRPGFFDFSRLFASTHVHLKTPLCGCIREMM